MFPNILVQLGSWMWEGDFSRSLLFLTVLSCPITGTKWDLQQELPILYFSWLAVGVQWAVCHRESTDTLNLKAALFWCSFKCEEWWMASSHKFLLYSCQQQESDAFLNMLWLLLVFVLALKKGNWIFWVWSILSKHCHSSEGQGVSGSVAIFVCFFRPLTFCREMRNNMNSQIPNCLWENYSANRVH